MDAHNLAVVFGPTLLRIPSEQDMIAYQSHVNSMMEVIIKHPEEIFPAESETDSVQLSEPDDDSEESDEGNEDENIDISKANLFNVGKLLQHRAGLLESWRYALLHDYSLILFYIYSRQFYSIITINTLFVVFLL